MIITIDTHYCSREELQELKDYLSNNSWDFKTNEVKEEKEVLHVLGENSINGIKIKERIFQEELFEYKIIDRKEFIDELIRWIGEAKSTDKVLMKQDLELLMNTTDDFMFSSISTNEYVGKEDSNFDELCEELLKLNKETKKGKK